jgi:hypothetical protein
MFVVRNRALGVLAALSIAALLVIFSALFDATANSPVQQQRGRASDRQADTATSPNLLTAGTGPTADASCGSACTQKQSLPASSNE